MADDDQITKMMQDPDFAKLSVGEQRKALAAHDQAFSAANDNVIGQFVNAHQANQNQPTVPNPVATKDATLKDYGDVTTSIGKGGAKSAGQTGLSFIHAARKALSSVIPSFAGEQNAGMGTDENQALSDENLNTIRQSLQPTNTPEKIGAGIEQTGEMMATGNPLRSATGLLPKVAQMGGRVGMEALNTVANAQIHGQDPNAAALAGAGGSALSETLPGLIPWLRSSAATQYGKVLNPTTIRNKNITNQIVPQLLDRNVVGTEGGLLKKASANVDALGNDITSAVQNVPASIQPNTQNIIDSLEKYKQGHMVNGVAVNQNAVQHASDLQDVIKQLGPNVSYQSLNKARQILDKGVAQSGGYAGKTLSEGSLVDAQKEAANAIRAELSRQSPDISKINAEFHFWKGVQDVMQDTAERRTGQAGGLIRNMLPFLGGAAGVAHGGMTPAGGLEGAGAIAVMAGIDQGVKSGLFRTMSAVSKARLADAMASGNMKTALDLLTRAGAAGASQVPQSKYSLENMMQAVRQQQ